MQSGLLTATLADPPQEVLWSSVNPYPAGVV
jgi:hypothetical protein